MPNKPEENKIEDNLIENDNEPVKFKGHFVSAIGRRKSAIARIRIYKKGNGVMLINGKKPSEFVNNDKLAVIKQPLKLSGQIRDFNISIVVKGGGLTGQVEAIRMALARGLVEIDNELRPSLKTKGLLKRDSRIKERKKPGFKKARRAPQWAKR